MIKFIYGSFGSGKTTEIMNMIAEDTKQGLPVFLLIPEQEAVQFERLTLSMLPVSSQLNLEVLGFSRLYNRVCREYGGLSYSYITKPIRSLLMWKNLRELSPLLEEYGPAALSDPSVAELMMNSIGELKANGITAAELETAAKKLPAGSPLSRRLRDVSLIYASFDNLISEKYSDSSDDLMRLRDALREHRFFEGTHVYIDSFTSFTSVEHQIIKEIFKQAQNVTIAVPLAADNMLHNDISAQSICASLERLKENAMLCGGYSEKALRDNKRATSPSLAYLSQNLWRLDVSESEAQALNDGSIVCELCDNPYAEAEAVASHTLKLLKGGARCKDIVVIMRDAEKYRGIIEPAFEKSGIPFFFSEKSDLCSLPPIKFILSALRIKRYGWQRGDVISHLKCGLYDIDIRSLSLFEEYTNTWNIRGNGFLGDEWTMNPDGFVTEISERGKEILASANGVKNKLVPPLEKFFIMLDSSEDIADMCRTLYSYMQEVGLEDKLLSLAEKASGRGEAKQSRELSSLYGIILNTLASVAEALEGEQADTEEFILILKTVFDKTEIGTIPTSIDEVTIGSASMLRASNPKYAMVMGLCEGEFPANVSDSGIFSMGDRKLLSEIGIELCSDTDTRSSDELMYVKRAFSVPSERLFLFSRTSELDGTERFPSLAFNRVKKLFKNIEIHKYDGADLDYLVPSPKNAVAHIRNIKDPKKAESLKKALEPYIPEITSMCQKTSEAASCRISKDTVDSFSQNTLRFSASSFEKYVRCPFSYYGTYVLRLREKTEARFKANDMGSFVHFILEQLLKNAIPSSLDDPMPTDEELIAKTEAVTEEYFARICPQSLLESKRLRHLCRRLKNLSLLLVRNIVKEFSHSQFRPAFFELRANGKDDNPAPMVFTLNDGCRVSFSGVIDRVDLLKKDGEVYIRVVDYKTGTKSFAVDDIKHGINTQMLLYLFTLCRNTSKSFMESVGVDGGKNASPAGVVYLSANIPVIESGDYLSSEEIWSNAADELERSGLLLGEEEILLAMNDGLDPAFLAGIKKNKKDDILSGKAMTSKEDFESIFEDMRSVILKISAELRGGCADASPLVYDGASPCEYCSFKPMCRKIN